MAPFILTASLLSCPPKPQSHMGTLESICPNFIPQSSAKGVSRHRREKKRRVGGGHGGEGGGRGVGLCPAVFLGSSASAYPAQWIDTSCDNSVQLTSRDSNFMSFMVPGLEEPGQGSGMGRGFEGHLSLENVSSRRYGRTFYFSPSLYPFSAVHRADGIKDYISQPPM